MTTTRTTATDADLKVGTIVYKGNGKVAYRICVVTTDCGRPGYLIVKTSTVKDVTTGGPLRAHHFTVESAVA